MDQTTVVSVRFSECDVYVGRQPRPGRKGWSPYFGNPFKVGRDGTSEEVLAKYERYFYERLATDAEFKRRVHELKGKRIGCYCYPGQCHADVIAIYLDCYSGIEDDDGAANQQ